MKLGEFFVELGVKSNTKQLSKTISELKKLESEVADEIELEEKLKKADNEETKAKIKKQAELKKEIAAKEKLLQTNKANAAAIKQSINGFMGIVSAAAVATIAIDRLCNAIIRSNQELINFRAQSGISLGTLNKYANANVMANPLTSIQSTAQSLQNVGSNLWDIQLGRGDVSAYQELSYFSGKAVEPYGKSVEQVIESVREALKSIDNDAQATNLITRMGFSPNDLQMLRMTKEEMKEFNGLFLSPEQREEMEKYGKELNKVHLQFALLKDKALLKILPHLLSLEQRIMAICDGCVKLAKSVGDVIDKFIGLNKFMRGLAAAGLAGVFALNPLIGALTMLGLLIEDFAVYKAGGKSVLGEAIDGFKAFFDAISTGIQNSGFVQFMSAMQQSLSTAATAATANVNKVGNTLGTMQKSLSTAATAATANVNKAGNTLGAITMPSFAAPDLAKMMMSAIMPALAGGSTTNNNNSVSNTINVHTNNPQVGANIIKSTTLDSLLNRIFK